MAVADPQKLMGGAKTTQTPVAQPQQQLIAAPADTAALQGISKSLTNIIQLLNEQKSQIAAEANQERKDLENARRKKIELGLENSFSAVKNVAQSVVAPVKNILDQIIQFFVTLFLGKALLNLIDWFSNPENQDKVRSIARFLKDWWPSLVAGYILFGTGFGRVVRNLAGIGLRAVVALGGIALKIGAAIAKAVGLKKAGAAMSALGGGGGFKGIAARLLTGTALAVGGGLIAKNMMGGGEDAPQVSVPEPATLPTAEAFGGGLIDFKAMLAASGGQVDSKLGIFAQLFGSGGFAGILNSIPGVVSGPKGIDKVPAMLTDGEFVMSRGAVQKFGVNTLEAMNAAGGGTNRPKIVQKRIYAAGGGPIGEQSVQVGTESRAYGGIDDIRAGYDAKHGAGAYDIFNARRKAERREQFAREDAEEKARQQRIASNTQLLANQRKNQSTPREKGIDYTSINRIRIPGLKVDSKALQSSVQGIPNSITSTSKSIPNSIVSSVRTLKTPQSSNEFTPEQQKRIAEEEAKARASKQKRDTEAEANRKAREEYDKIISNPNDPRYDDAWSGKLTIDSLKPAATATPAAGTTPKPAAETTPKPAAGTGYTPYQSRFAGARDAAFAKAKTIGGFMGVRSQDYYKANTAAREKELSGLTSQQRLNKLSYAGFEHSRSGQASRGVRFDAEDKARRKETEGRGGLLGQIGRGFTSMFGSQKDIDRNKAADAASAARVKQAGAASIGRYYSSSDGKYYANYAEAQKARAARLGSNKPVRQPITPTPKPAPRVYNPAGGGMGGRRGSSGGSKGTKTPVIPSGKDTRTTANLLNIKPA